MNKMLVDALVPELAGLYWGMNGVELTARIGPGRMVDRAPGVPFWEVDEDTGLSFILKPGDRLCMVGLSLNRVGRLDDTLLQGKIQATYKSHLRSEAENFADLQWENEDTRVVINAPENLMVAGQDGKAHPMWGLTFVSKKERGARLWWGGILP
jgi:hypothetical protein